MIAPPRVTPARAAGAADDLPKIPVWRGFATCRGPDYPYAMKKHLIIGIFGVVAMSASACAPGGTAGPTPATARVAPDSFLVTVATSKGDFVAKAHRDWSPLAVDRFYELVKGSVWNDARIFRVVPQFVVQWGLTGDSAKDNAWIGRPVPDEPVKVANTKGRISFARGGPRSRTLQVFINLGDNSRSLDRVNAGGVVGYPPFAEVVSGMAVVEKLESKYGDQPTMLQQEMSEKGWSWLDAKFPGLDRIRTTRVTKEWR
jgi:cyclophilin family peptidyl-prolyl cis-trans isomerase